MLKMAWSTSSGAAASYDACLTLSVFNVEGSKRPTFCKKHTQEGMLNVMKKSCAHGACVARASHNVLGNGRPTFCKNHAEDGMVNAVVKRCSHGACELQRAR